jgi:hypothetical protein
LATSYRLQQAQWFVDEVQEFDSNISLETTHIFLAAGELGPPYENHIILSDTHQHADLAESTLRPSPYPRNLSTGGSAVEPADLAGSRTVPGQTQ